MTTEAPEPIERRLPVLATYDVNVSFRGAPGTQVPTISELEEAVETTLASLGGGDAVAVRASAQRTDR